MPTGARATTELFEKLAAFGKKHAIAICNDNPYSFILEPKLLKNEKLPSLLAVKDAKDTCLELNSMSKSHNMPGWRVGMLASNPQFVEWVQKVKSNIDSGMFRPVQTAAVAALSCENAWHHQYNYQTYNARRAVALQIMEALGCTCSPTQAGMFLWGKIPQDYPGDAQDLAEQVLHRARVFVVPGFIFGSNGARYIRLSLCATEDRFVQALNRIKQTLQ
jgi:aspartate/methionine/tyrosine aminotransferase